MRNTKVHSWPSLVVMCGILIGSSGTSKSAELVHQAAHLDPTAANQWLEVLLEASARDVDRHQARPPILSRAMAIAVTSMFDAWAAYDDKAIGTRLGHSLRRPPSERTQGNKETAIAYAVYRSLLDVFPDEADWIRGEMRRMKFDPNDHSVDLSSPIGIGLAAANAVIESRHHDGANQLGDESGSNGQPYSDYTYYRPLNTPERIVSPTHWLPIPFRKPNGETFSPGFLAAHWYRVRPFALDRADQFRPPPPPEYGSEQLRKDVAECVELNAALTLEMKAVVEFMRDGPRSTGQSGHWLRFAQDVSRRDRYSLDQDVKLFFCVANVVFDTFVASWEAKRFYDTGRPYWWVRLDYQGQKINGWAGPGRGTAVIAAEDWHPYSPVEFVTPPFPGYPSGHATASGGAAKILELFTGGDEFGAVAFRQVGELTEGQFPTQAMQAVNGKPATNVPESKVIKLALPTFTATAEMAAVSRLWGGYHIRTDNTEGLKLGRKIAEFSWTKYQAYFDGSRRQ